MVVQKTSCIEPIIVKILIPRQGAMLAVFMMDSIYLLLNEFDIVESVEMQNLFYAQTLAYIFINSKV